MRYLLDTNICIELIRGRGAKVLERLKRCKIGEVGISAITLAELEHGVEKSAQPERNRLALSEFCAPLEVRPFDDAAAAAYGKVRAVLERAGKILGPMDLLIAAHALAEGGTLITNNEREFRRVHGLTIENWL
ncbi:MAG: type II toxin-antitoxin system VapC family toxin [Candidatus Hydrogenedentes bacterium]|nr:type II toxin-antitoxin system VapC family toxin [Candidatus Hydrogenedentota bacterium]